MLPAKNEILTAALKRFLQHFGISSGKIGWRQHIEHLPYREFDDRLVLRGNAADSGSRIMPPLLIQQKRLCEQIEQRQLPLRRGEAPVLRLRPDQEPRQAMGR